MTKIINNMTAKRFLSLFLAIVMTVVLIPITGVSAATSGYYTYTVANGEATITDVDESISGAVTIPSTLGGYKVTEIGYEAFYSCKNLTSITIPDSVTSIGDSAFEFCYRLTSINIPDSVTEIGYRTFYNCISLTSITIPDNVTSIGDYAFGTCEKLTSITIPESVTSIGVMAFSHCEKLTSITIPDSVTNINYGVFCGCNSLTSITIPDSVTSIGDSAFKYCSSLTSITIPDSVTSIGETAFGYCYSLTDITIPYGITSIGDNTFISCTGLTSITIPDSVTSIGEEAFWECNSLTSISIPDSVTSIGKRAFYECTGLTSITIPDSVTRIDLNAFYGCTGLTSVYITDIAAWCSIVFLSNPLTYAGNLYLNGELVTDLVIPAGVKSISSGAFRDCTSLTSITIPASVTRIDSSTFLRCTSLTDIEVADDNTEYADINGVLFTKDEKELICYPAGKTNNEYSIPESVTSIGQFAFAGCTSLTSITIPDSVTSIGYGAFSDCPNLTISCNKNSYAHTYAVDNSIPYVLLNCDHSSTKRINAIEETCTTDGYTGDIVCADCGELIEEGDPILTLGHSSDVRGAVDATCTTDGATGESYCDWCGEVFQENTVIPAFGHTWDDGVINDTVKTFTCLTCGETYTENHEHTPAEKFVDATCTKDGCITTYCTDCGHVISEEIIPAKGHTPYNDFTYYVTVPATCYEDGSLTIYCSVCQGVASFEILPARNHMRKDMTEAWGEEFVSKYPTVDEVGYFSQKCELRDCDAVRVTREIECLRDPDIMVIDGVMTEYLGNGGKVKIPGNVTAIADGAFEGNSTVTEIVIHSGVTAIGDGALADMTVLETVKFIGSEEQWNEIEKAEDFDAGTSYEMEYKALDFVGASVTLNSDLRVNYKVDGSLFEDCYESPYVVFTMCGEETTVEEYTVQDGSYVFSFDGISPAMMNENISAVLYATYDGAELSAKTRDYSIATYCRNLLRMYTSDAYATMRTLLVDMLNYGAASQNYTGYNTDSLANGKLTDEQAALGTKDVREYESLFDKDYAVCESPAAEWKSAGLVLGDSVTMRFRLATDCLDDITIKIVGDGGEWTVTSDELFEEADGGCYVYFDGFTASQMSEAGYVTAYIGDTAVSNTLRYSIESYAASKMDEDPALTELLIAMMKYGDAAAAFAGR